MTVSEADGVRRVEPGAGPGHPGPAGPDRPFSTVHIAAARVPLVGQSDGVLLGLMRWAGVVLRPGPQTVIGRQGLPLWLARLTGWCTATRSATSRHAGGQDGQAADRMGRRHPAGHRALPVVGVLHHQPDGRPVPVDRHPSAGARLGGGRDRHQMAGQRQLHGRPRDVHRDLRHVDPRADHPPRRRPQDRRPVD